MDVCEWVWKGVEVGMEGSGSGYRCVGMGMDVNGSWNGCV